MNAAASVTTDDGDKVNHGWSQLDIAKHSTNTFVSSLEDDDYFSVVTYSDGANVRRQRRLRSSKPLRPHCPPRAATHLVWFRSWSTGPNVTKLAESGALQRFIT